MPRHLIGDAHEWINEIPTVPTYSVAKLQPSQRSWFLYLCVVHSRVTQMVLPIFTFRLTLAFRAWDLNWLYAQQRGKKTLLSLTLICYCQLISTAKIVRGSWFRSTTMKHRYLTIWLTYCISIAYTWVLVEKHSVLLPSERVSCVFRLGSIPSNS